MSAVGVDEVAGHACPVVDLGSCVRIGDVRTGAAGERLAIEVLELRGDLADDPRLTLGGEAVERQARPDERLPVTHWNRP